MAHTTRRTFLAGSAAVAASGLAPARAQTLRKIKVGKAVTTSFPFAGLEVGQESGIWKKNGLDIEIAAFRGDGQMQQAFAAGAVDFGFGSGPGMGYAAKGVPAHAVASVADALTAHGFAAHAESRGSALRLVAEHCPFGEAAHLRADVAVGNVILVRAIDLGDAAAAHRDVQRARIGTIEGARGLDDGLGRCNGWLRHAP